MVKCQYLWCIELWIRSWGWFVAEHEVFEILLSDGNDNDSNSAPSSQHGDCDNDENDDGSRELILDTKEKTNIALPNSKMKQRYRFSSYVCLLYINMLGIRILLYSDLC